MVGVESKRPAELCASAGLNFVLDVNSASHTRRRALRVMVVVMVPIQHEILSYRRSSSPVNSEKLIAPIVFVDGQALSGQGAFSAQHSAEQVYAAFNQLLTIQPARQCDRS